MRFFIILLFAVYVFASNYVLQNLDYNSSKESFFNPDIGFYSPIGLSLKESENKAIVPHIKFLHLRVDIAAFSSNAFWTEFGKTIYGNSEPISENALNALEETFKNVRAKGGFVIVRVCYDKNYNGYANQEPSQDIIKLHLKQLGEIYAKYMDVITVVEFGMYGSYGEAHTSACATDSLIGNALAYFLENTPNNVRVNLRTAHNVAAGLGFTDYGKTFNINSEMFKQIASKNANIYRVGMFNDGYLGTEYDYGSWSSNCETGICRAEGIEWLETYGINMPYGGEALTTASGYKKINTAEFLEYEGFKTHTSYLNSEWNNNLINEWKNTIFKGKDELYKGETSYKYINDHLGYRFVLTSSEIFDSVTVGKTFLAKLKIKNVGFGNVIRDLKTTLILKNNSEIFEVPVEMTEPKNIHSKKISVNGSDTIEVFDGTNNLNLKATLSKNILPANYNVFLRFSIDGNFKEDNNYGTVRFANVKEQFDSLTGANFIGNFIVTEKEVSTNILNKNANANFYFDMNKKRLVVDNKNKKNLVQIFDVNGVKIFSEKFSGTRIISLKNVAAYVLVVNKSAYVIKQRMLK